MTIEIFLGILAIHFIAAVSPGPSFVVAVKTAITEGFWPATGMAVGLGLGACIWAVSALVGLAILLELVPSLMLTLRIGAGVFLGWIALQMWRHAEDPLPEISTHQVPRSTASALRLGLATQIANPKPAIFFGAVFVGLVPQGTPWPLLALLLFFIFFNETLWYIFVGRVFSLPKARKLYGGTKTIVDRLFGGIIALFAARIAST